MSRFNVAWTVYDLYTLYRHTAYEPTVNCHQIHHFTLYYLMLQSEKRKKTVYSFRCPTFRFMSTYK